MQSTIDPNVYWPSLRFWVANSLLSWVVSVAPQPPSMSSFGGSHINVMSSSFCCFTVPQFLVEKIFQQITPQWLEDPRFTGSIQLVLSTPLRALVHWFLQLAYPIIAFRCQLMIIEAFLQHDDLLRERPGALTASARKMMNGWWWREHDRAIKCYEYVMNMLWIQMNTEWWIIFDAPNFAIVGYSKNDNYPRITFLMPHLHKTS